MAWRLRQKHFASQFLGSKFAGQLDEKTGVMNMILERHLSFEDID
jgi:hypothetical protein